MHRHAIICVSGFLQDKQDKISPFWLSLTNYCRVRQIPLFVVRWQSKSETELEGHLETNTN